MLLDDNDAPSNTVLLLSSSNSSRTSVTQLQVFLQRDWSSMVLLTVIELMPLHCELHVDCTYRPFHAARGRLNWRSIEYMPYLKKAIETHCGTNRSLSLLRAISE